MFCAFCHENGAPKWVYTNHDEEHCRKSKAEDEKHLSGGSRSKHSYQQNAKREMKAMKKKYIKLKKATKELHMIQSLKNQKKKNPRSRIIVPMNLSCLKIQIYSETQIETAQFMGARVSL